MNYRHAFHAGNFADCVKHALLAAWLRRLRLKDAPFGVLDTHAGAGRYALDSEEANRTAEWLNGIGRVASQGLCPWTPLGAAPPHPHVYPGSPVIIQSFLRPQDTLIACELHPDDHRALRATLAGDPRCAVHIRDGYEAITALLPPRAARRGLVFIDPPFEQPGEFERVAIAIRQARTRFPTGGVLAWYPIKGRAPSRAFHASLDGVRDVVAFEFCLRAPVDPSRLNGCGLLAVAPPFGLGDEARTILPTLLGLLGDGEAGQATSVTRLADE